MKFFRNILNKARWFDLYLLTFQKHNVKKIFLPLYAFSFINLFVICTANAFWKFFFVKPVYAINALLSSRQKPPTNKSCFILANGPSLTKKKLLKINSQDVFVCNNFLLVNSVKTLNIKYNVITDIGYIGNLKKRKKKSWLYLMSKIKKQPEVLFFPSYFRKSLKTLINFGSTKVNYFKELPYPTEEYIPNHFDLKTGIPWSYNVSISMINLAVGMGYKNIKLIGFDTTQHLGSDYYERKKYNKIGLRKKNTSKYRLIENCSNILGMWSTYRFLKAHENIKRYCKKNNIIIKNLSNTGILDTY
jgi:hypothetical protein